MDEEKNINHIESQLLEAKQQQTIDFGESKAWQSNVMASVYEYQRKQTVEELFVPPFFKRFAWLSACAAIICLFFFLSHYNQLFKPTNDSAANVFANWATTENTAIDNYFY